MEGRVHSYISMASFLPQLLLPESSPGLLLLRWVFAPLTAASKVTIPAGKMECVRSMHHSWLTRDSKLQYRVWRGEQQSLQSWETTCKGLTLKTITGQLAYLSEIEVDLLQRVILLLQGEYIGSISDCSSLLLFLLIASNTICGALRRVVLDETNVGPEEVDIVVRVPVVAGGCWC